MMRSSKGRVFRAENTQWNSSEAEANLVSVRNKKPKKKLGGRRG